VRAGVRAGRNVKKIPQENPYMKRFHVHVSVSDLNQSIGFYSTLFGSEPTVRKHDYAKWMLDDPRLNFAISKRARGAGVNHLGFQVDDAAELDALHERLMQADKNVVEEKQAACCYARSDKYWITDPQGIAWENFHSLGSVPVYGDDAPVKAEGAACCVPLKQSNPAEPCCVPAAPAKVGGCCAGTSA
jgi:catechol 2,3-dioxygenase-like lactoylglutathione lyase family enzyme